NARSAKGQKSALEFCNDAKNKLSQVKQAMKKSNAGSVTDQALRSEVATVYFEHGKILASLGKHNLADDSYKKVALWGGHIDKSGALVQPTGRKSDPHQVGTPANPATTASATLLSQLSPVS
ncbi:hypothetical protein BGX27_007005, partial [Mortierella sp. AM989]